MALDGRPRAVDGRTLLLLLLAVGVVIALLSTAGVQAAMKAEPAADIETEPPGASRRGMPISMPSDEKDMPAETKSAINEARRDGKLVEVWRIGKPGAWGPWQYKVHEKGEEPGVLGRPEDLLPAELVPEQESVRTDPDS